MTAAAPAPALAMSRGVALRALIEGVQADLAAYAVLQQGLAAQFEAALKLDTARLTILAAAIADQVARLEAHRAERTRLVAQLGLKAPAAMAAVPALFDAPRRPAVAALWRALEARVADCQAANRRNGRLLVDQQALLQRLLEGEVHTYAPA